MRISQAPLLKNNVSFVKRHVPLVPRKSVSISDGLDKEQRTAYFECLGKARIQKKLLMTMRKQL